MTVATSCAVPPAEPLHSQIAPEAARTAPQVQIDHLILGINDLHKGVEELENRTGVRAAYGGPHPGEGTHNALLSLGEGIYLEILAPNPSEKVDSPVVRQLQSLGTLTPAAWVASTRNLEELRTTLQGEGLALTPTKAGDRSRPDGVRLEWEIFGIAHPAHPLAPLFIHWRDPARHPSLTAPGGCTLISLQFEDPQPQRLAAAIRPLSLSVPVNRGTAPRMKFSLACPRGTVEFG